MNVNGLQKRSSAGLECYSLLAISRTDVDLWTVSHRRPRRDDLTAGRGLDQLERNWPR